MSLLPLKSGSDIRGTAQGPEANLTQDTAKKLSFAFVRFIAVKTGKKEDEITVALGRDSRLSGPVLMDAAAEGLCRAGASVISFGLCTTPAMYVSLLTPGFESDGAIMITASHMPMDKNGMKFFTKDGGLESEDILFLIEQADALTTTESFSFSGNIAEKAFLPAYREILSRRIRDGLDTDVQMPLLGLHVIVDAGNGAGGFFADMLASLGAWTEGSLFLEPDGRFPHHVPNPENEQAIAMLSKAVLKHGADMGVIFDADCDRAAIVDPSGRPVNRNRLIALVSAILLDKEPGITIVTDSVTSSGLSDFIGEWGGVHYRYKRGYQSVIREAMLLNRQGVNCPLAIETSGHAALRENHFLDDGMYLVTMLIVEAMRMKQDGRVLSSLIADLKEPAESREIRLHITNPDFRRTGLDAIERVLDYATAMESWHIAPDNREGVRISYDYAGGIHNGWFLLRLSVHDPVLALNAESDVLGGVQAMLTDLLKVLDGCPGIDFTPLVQGTHDFSNG